MSWKHLLSPRRTITQFLDATPYVEGKVPNLALLRISSSIVGIGNSYSTKRRVWENPFDKSRLTRCSLTPHTVKCALDTCPSDLIALSLFLWCARQPNYFHDYATIDHMVHVVARLAQKFHSANGIIRELKSVGCALKAQTFLFLFRIFWRGGMYSMVFDVLDEMIKSGYKLNEFSSSVIMDISFRIGHVDVALSMLNEMPVPKFFDAALCSLCRLNDLVNLKMVIRTMLAKRFYPSEKTLLMILNSLCKQCRFVEAFQVVGLMTALGIQLSVSVWSILIDGLCKTGRYTEAVVFLEKMVHMGFSPGVVTYTCLFKWLLASRLVDDAFRILDLIECSGCEVDLVFFNVVMDFLLKLGRYDEALDVFFEMRKQNLKPDKFTLSSVLSTFTVTGKFPLLIKFVAGFNIAPDIVVYNSLLWYFNKVGLPSYALRLFENMLARGFMLDKYTCVGILSTLFQDNRVQEAVNFYNGIVMRHFDVDAHVHTVMLGGLVEAGFYNRAILLFRKVLAKKYPLDVVSCTIAIIGLVRGRRVGEAYTLYKQMKALSIVPNRRTCNTMILGLCKERDLCLVSQIIEEMLDAHVKLDFRTCMKVADLMFKLGPSPEIFALLIDMWNSALISDNAILVLLVEGIAKGIHVDDMYYPSLEGYEDMPSSQCQSNVTALVG